MRQAHTSLASMEKAPHLPFASLLEPRCFRLFCLQLDVVRFLPIFTDIYFRWWNVYGHPLLPPLSPTGQQVPHSLIQLPHVQDLLCSALDSPILLCSTLVAVVISSINVNDKYEKWNSLGWRHGGPLQSVHGVQQWDCHFTRVSKVFP